MHSRTREAFVSRGIPTNLIDKISENGHTLSELATMSKSKLIGLYGDVDGQRLFDTVKRKPIPGDTVAEILRLSASACCFCRDGVAAPYQVHHVTPFSETQDHSLHNLALVCPTHHEMIHQDDTPRDEQLAQRDGWYAIVAIAAAYADAGQTYPYGAYEPLLYTAPPRPERILEGREPSPSTCLLLAQNSELATRGVNTLISTNLLVLVGGPGSGKSTLAVGIAGRLAGQRVAFRYRAVAQHQSNRQAVQELLNFIQLTRSPAVLVIDDFNAWGNAADLDVVLAAATPKILAVVVWSDDAVGEEQRDATSHALASTLRISWSALTPSILSFIDEHEAALTPHVRSARSERDYPRVGHGVLDRPLSMVARTYAKEARSAWHFTYLLRGGWQTVADDLNDLVNSDLDFAPVLHVCIEQIAGFEQPLSVEEAAERCASLPVRLTTDQACCWISRLFQRLLLRKKFLKSRHGYLTVHREWCREFIGAAIRSPDCNPTARSIFTEGLERCLASPRRLGILLSWFGHYRPTRQLVEDWVQGQDAHIWAAVLASALDDGLVTTSMLLSNLSNIPSRKVGDALPAEIARLGKLVVQSDQQWSWYRVRELVFAVKKYGNSLLQRMLSEVPADHIAKRIVESPASDFEDISWFLNSSGGVDDPWCRRVWCLTPWPELIDNFAATVEPGDIRSIEELCLVSSSLGSPRRFSTLKGIAKCIQAAVRHSSPSNLRTSPIFFIPILESFPSLTDPIMRELNAGEWARAIEGSSPQCWQHVMMLCGFAARSGSTFAQALATSINLEQMTDVVSMALSDPHDMLFLLSILSQAAQPQAKKAAAILGPVIEPFVQEKPQLLQSLANVDFSVAFEISTRVSMTIDPQSEIKPLFSPWRDRLPPEIICEIAAIEALGEDCDLRDLARRIRTLAG